MIYSLTWLAVILGKELTCYVKESVCLDPRLRGDAAHIVWVKVVLEAEVNCEKRSFRVLLCTRDVRRSEDYVCDALLFVSEHIRFVIGGDGGEVAYHCNRPTTS